MNRPGSYTLNVALKTTLPITPHRGFLLHAVSGVSLRIFLVFLDASINCLGPLSFAGWRGMLEAHGSIPVFLQQCFWELSVYITPIEAKRDSEEKGRRKACELKLDVL